MGQIIDNTIALRIIWLLVRAFTSWDAFKLGLIDENGERTDKPVKSEKEKDSWTMLHRLVARLKRIVALAPGGKSLLARLTAAYLLVRESQELGVTFSDQELTECYLLSLHSINSDNVAELIPVFEEVATGVAVIPVTRDNQPSTLLGPKPKKKLSYKDQNMMFRRQTLPEVK